MAASYTISKALLKKKKDQLLKRAMKESTLKQMGQLDVESYYVAMDRVMDWVDDHKKLSNVPYKPGDTIIFVKQVTEAGKKWWDVKVGKIQKFGASPITVKSLNGKKTMKIPKNKIMARIV